MTDQASEKQLRSFGLIVGSVFLLIGLWPVLFRGGALRWWAIAAGGALVLPALLYPSSLRLPHRAWMAVGHVLGWINTRILLSVVFVAVMTPTGLALRLFGKSALALKIDNRATTYRIKKEPRAPTHMKHQY